MRSTIGSLNPWRHHLSAKCLIPRIQLDPSARKILRVQNCTAKPSPPLISIHISARFSADFSFLMSFNSFLIMPCKFLFVLLLLSSTQFKVLRRGSWKNINFEPTESRPSVLNDLQALSRNPWIHHFRAARKQKNVACKSQAISSGERNSSFPFGSTNNSGPMRACDSHLSQQYISSNRGRSLGLWRYKLPIFVW